MRGCRARALRRAGCGRSMPYLRALREREAYVLRCKVVAPFALQFRAARHRVCAHALANHTALALSREEAQHARLPRARATPRWLWPLHALWKGTVRARGLHSSMQGRGPICLLVSRGPPSRVRTRACESHSARCVLGGGAARAVAARARHAALAVVVPFPMEGHCSSERPAFFGARSWAHAPSSSARLAFACAHTRLGITRRSLYLGRRRSSSVSRARAPRRAGCGRSMPYGRALREREAYILRCNAVVSRTSFGLHFAQPAFACSAIARHTALTLPREEAQLALLPRARATPRWLWPLHALGKGTARARGLYSSVQGRGPTR